MKDLLPYITLAAAFVILFFVTRKPSYQPGIDDNHTIPPKKALEIATAALEDRPAVFHGGCVDCIWRHQNTTHTGIAFCRGCTYFAFNRSLPDKSISEYDLEKIR